LPEKSGKFAQNNTLQNDYVLRLVSAGQMVLTMLDYREFCGYGLIEATKCQFHVGL
jgi:hypothetical protein